MCSFVSNSFPSNIFCSMASSESKYVSLKEVYRIGQFAFHFFFGFFFHLISSECFIKRLYYGRNNPSEWILLCSKIFWYFFFFLNNFNMNLSSILIFTGITALVSVWDENLLNEYISLAKSGRPKGKTFLEKFFALILWLIVVGNYEEDAARGLQLEIQKLNVKGKHILVVGSESPWVEAILLAEGKISYKKGWLSWNYISLFNLLIYQFNFFFYFCRR